MKGEYLRRVLAVVLGSVGALFANIDADAALTTNNWTFAGSGKWETAARWSAGVPISTDTANLITNATTKAVTNDAMTVLSNAVNGCMTISNLIMSAPSGVTNTLFLNNAGVVTPVTPLHILNSLILNSNTVVAVSNSALVVNNSFIVGNAGANNRLAVTLGSLSVTNAAGTGVLDIRRGTFTFAGDLPAPNHPDPSTVDQLLLTNGANSVMTFNAGTLQSGATFVTNTQPFVVGNATNTAIYHLLGGIHSFNDGARIRSNSFLTGCGTISGTVVVDSNATVLADCGGTLTFTGSVTNNGSMQARNGTTLEAYGTVVNNGRITAFLGYTNFHGTFINNGTVVTSITIGNGPSEPDGSYYSATNLRQNLFTNNIKLGSTNDIDIAEDVDLAHSTFGVAGRALTLTARTINLTNDITFGNGIFDLEALTVNLDGRVTNVLGALVSPPRLTGTATNVNVLSGAASLQQAVDLSSPTNPVTLQVSSGQYPGDVAIKKTVTLLTTGGTASVLSNLVVGDCTGGTNGVVTFSSGTLYVTNATGTAALIVRKGSFTQTGGTLKFDKLVLTNACGATFTRTGGTLILDPDLDVDSDGLPNGYEQSHGFDPLDPADAGADPDGDGFSNLLEYREGTDPNDINSSPFRVTAIEREDNDVRVTWLIGLGRTNALERSAGDASGSYSNNFVAIFTVTNATGVVTNYLDTGAATNVPVFYYRVRLIP